MRSIRNVIAASLGVFVVLPFVLFLASFINTASEQDACEFGSVKNAEYRKMLARARAQDWTVWPTLSNGILFPSNRAFSPPKGDLNQQIADHLALTIQAFSVSGSSSDKWIAVTHAVMRSMGAQYDETNIVPESGSTEVIGLEYYMPQRRFAPFCLHCFVWDLTNIRVTFERLEPSSDIALRKVIVRDTGPKFSPTRTYDSACPSANVRRAASR